MIKSVIFIGTEETIEIATKDQKVFESYRFHEEVNLLDKFKLTIKK